MEKTVAPTTQLTIYGIEVDSIAMECRLPHDKIVKIQEKLEGFCKRKKVQLKELQSLIGLLNFACSVIVPGRTFLRRLIDLTCGISKPFYWVRLTKETRADLTMQLQFISQFNGKSVFLAKEWDFSDFISLYTDASGSIGISEVLGEQWFTQQWSEELLHFQIAIKELFPIVLALEIWGCQLQNKKILLLTDNMAIVQVINKQSRRTKAYETCKKTCTCLSF